MKVYHLAEIRAKRAAARQLVPVDRDVPSALAAAQRFHYYIIADDYPARVNVDTLKTEAWNSRREWMPDDTPNVTTHGRQVDEADALAFWDRREQDDSK